MSRPGAAILLMLGFLLTAAATSARGEAALGAHRPDGDNQRLTAAVASYLRPLQDLDVFSGVVLIARGGRVLLAKGYGLSNVEHAIPNRPEGVFRIASLSKPFTEIAIGRLVDRGMIALDDSLARFIPDFPNGGRVTLRMLLEHRAGIPNMNSIPWDEEAVIPGDLDSLVRVLAARPLDFEPGSRRRYSNGGYALLAKVIERASGTDYASFLAREVTGPMGLAQTRHEEDLIVVPGRAYGYQPGTASRHALVVAPFQQMSTKTGGGSLVSTAGDLHRFLLALYRSPVLAPATWRALFGEQDSLFFFQGRCPGFNVVAARWFEDDLCVVVLANNYAAGMVAEVARALAELARGRTPAPIAWRADVPADSSRCAAYCGRWRAAEGDLPIGDLPLSLAWSGGELMASAGRLPFDVLLPQPDGSFLLRTLWSTVRFDGETGELRYLWRNGGVRLVRSR